MSKTILVTGTNSGFGRLTALALAKKGHRVFGTMRAPAAKNRERAEELRAAKIHVVDMELTSDASVDAAVREVLGTAGRIDALINNAGYGLIGLEETVTPAQLTEQLDVNVVGAQRVLRAVLPGMREQKRGTVVLVSSGLGRIVLPMMGAYSASKAALEALGDAYRMELGPLGIGLTIVQPGAFPTDFRARTAIGGDQTRAKGYGPFEHGLDGLQKNFDQMLSGPAAQNPNDVSDALVALVESDGPLPDRVVVDKLNPHGVVALNKAHLEVQTMLMAAFGGNR